LTHFTWLPTGQRLIKQYIHNIYYMPKPKYKPVTKLRLANINGFYKRKVTKFGNGAKVDCPKEHLGKTVYLVIVDD